MPVGSASVWLYRIYDKIQQQLISELATLQTKFSKFYYEQNGLMHELWKRHELSSYLDAWVFFSTFRIRKKNALSQALYLIYVSGWNQIWQLSKSDRVWQLVNWQLSETVQLKQNALACRSCPSHVKACKFLFL